MTCDGKATAPQFGQGSTCRLFGCQVALVDGGGIVAGLDRPKPRFGHEAAGVWGH